MKLYLILLFVVMASVNADFNEENPDEPEKIEEHSEDIIQGRSVNNQAFVNQLNFYDQKEKKTSSNLDEIINDAIANSTSDEVLLAFYDTNGNSLSYDDVQNMTSKTTEINEPVNSVLWSQNEEEENKYNDTNGRFLSPGKHLSYGDLFRAIHSPESNHNLQNNHQYHIQTTPSYGATVTLTHTVSATLNQQQPVTNIAPATNNLQLPNNQNLINHLGGFGNINGYIPPPPKYPVPITQVIPSIIYETSYTVETLTAVQTRQVFVTRTHTVYRTQYKTTTLTRRESTFVTYTLKPKVTETIIQTNLPYNVYNTHHQIHPNPVNQHASTIFNNQNSHNNQIPSVVSLPVNGNPNNFNDLTRPPVNFIQEFADLYNGHQGHREPHSQQLHDNLNQNSLAALLDSYSFAAKSNKNELSRLKQAYMSKKLATIIRNETPIQSLIVSLRGNKKDQHIIPI